MVDRTRSDQEVIDLMKGKLINRSDGRYFLRWYLQAEPWLLSKQLILGIDNNKCDSLYNDCELN